MDPQTNFHVLTISCHDTVGIVAAVSGFLSSRNIFITESAHYGDPETNRFFMRTVFRATAEPAELDELKQAFAAIGEKFGMNWEISDTSKKPRVLILVSKFDHCLNDLLYRYRIGALPIEIPAVVSNHPDLQRVVEWHGIPYHHLPVTKETKAAQEAKNPGNGRAAEYRSGRPRPLHAGALRRHVQGAGLEDDQHPPQLPAELQGRQALPSGPCARREDHRRHRPLRHQRPRRGADHRAGGGARRSHADRRGFRRHRARHRKCRAVARGEISRRAAHHSPMAPRPWCFASERQHHRRQALRGKPSQGHRRTRRHPDGANRTRARPRRGSRRRRSRQRGLCELEGEADRRGRHALDRGTPAGRHGRDDSSGADRRTEPRRQRRWRAGAIAAARADRRGAGSRRDCA